MSDVIYSKRATVWWIFKRFLRIALPQVPTFIACFDKVIPIEYAPLCLGIGTMATTLDKVFREYGVYDSINPFSKPSQDTPKG